MYKSNNGHTWSATIDDYQVVLHPQSRRRYLVSVTHKNGYCAPWPIWPPNLDEAKRKALVVIEVTRAHFATYCFVRHFVNFRPNTTIAKLNA